ncbi:phage tail protein [Pseudomonas sp. NFIX28]|uniref:phage tail protein n=1 Tax=Pseudomonas sp. NFIX28 TaxID=1566235 RepID=UPI000896D754|nr:phage tail protein [Pseudomonas sp. NFIX28]SDY38079.1 Microcystin-dependent protein [Pseudomonas sp. NFIX28]
MVDTVPENAVGPSVETLKDIFGVQKVPLASNFSDLIDIADTGRKAVGLSPAQDGVPGIGLQLDSSQKLAVRPKAESGVRVDGDGVGVIPDVSKGIKVDANGVGIVADSSKGIKVDVSGIGVDFGASLKVANGKLEVADSFAAPPSALSDGVDFNTVVPPAYRVGVYAVSNGSTYLNRPATANGLAGNAFLMMFSHGSSNSNDCTQIYFNAVGGMWLRAKHDGATVFTAWGRVNAVVADPAKGITVNDNVVGVNHGTSLTMANGKLEVAPNAGIPSGLIVMFSGAVIPAGWALCDGTGGRPDLRNRFILGGNLSEVSGRSSEVVDGAANNKSSTVNTSSSQPSIRVTVNPHTLTGSQIPGHNHLGGLQLTNYYNWGDLMSYYGSVRYGKPSGKTNVINANGHNDGLSTSVLSYTSTTGGGQAHSHGGSAEQSAHSHSVNTVPPYYILAFIMKL